MKETKQPGALLLVSNHCPHCHGLETLLRERMKTGALGGLRVVNIEQSPELAKQYGVRSVPWLQLGDFVFDGAMTPSELDEWIEQVNADGGQTRYIAYLLERGKLVMAIEWIEKSHTTLQVIIPLLVDPDARINIRVGVGAILEHFEDTDVIRAITFDLIGLLDNENPAIRTDVCHYLSLTHSIDVIAPLKQMLDDDDPQVREIARESIEALM